MNESDLDPRDNSKAHRWRDQLGGVWLQDAPSGREWRSLYAGGFVAFLWAIGHKANADGSNSIPPASRWLGNATGSSKDSVRRYWMAAASLGVVHVEMSVNGRYVRGYRLVITPAYLLDWEGACRALRDDTRRIKQEEKRGREFVAATAAEARARMAERRESARADSPDRNAGTESARADSRSALDTLSQADGEPSPHVRTPENGSESARADSPGETAEPSESARADSASPHGAEVSPHVRTYQGSPGLYQDGADVLSLPADPRGSGLELPPLWSGDEYADDETGPGDWESDAWMGSAVEPSGRMSAV